MKNGDIKPNTDKGAEEREQANKGHKTSQSLIPKNVWIGPNERKFRQARRPSRD
jgi:hypothetical protein